MTRLQSFYRDAAKVSESGILTLMAEYAQPRPDAAPVAAEKTATAERRLSLMGYLEALEGNSAADIADAKERFMDDFCVSPENFKTELKRASQHLI